MAEKYLFDKRNPFGKARPKILLPDPGEPPETPILVDDAETVVTVSPSYGRPDALWRGPSKASRASPADLAETAPDPSKNYVAVSAEGAILRLAFGQNLLPAEWGVVHSIDDAYLYLLLVWCRGKCGGFNGVYAGADEIGVDITNIQIANYLGDTPETVDPWLSTFVPGYADQLDGICHSVVRLDARKTTSVPQFSADINCLELFDPRNSITNFSRNPALAYRYAALLMGLEVDDNDIEAAADACETSLGGSWRRRFGVYFDQPSTANEILLTLAEYAGAFHYVDGETARLIPDRPASVSMSFTWDESDGTKKKIREGSFRLRKKSRRQSPNYVKVAWTDKSVFPWRRRIAYPSAFPSGTVIQTLFDMPGIQSYAEANRQRIERTNRYNLTDLEVEFVAFDEAQELETGDVFDIDSPDLTAKQFRAISVRSTGEPGQVFIEGEEYDPAVYSDSVVAEPTYPDTDLPDPNAIPTGPTLTELVEVLWTDNARNTFTVFRIKWLGVSWAWARFYHVKVYSGTDVILDQDIRHQGTGVIHEIRTAPTSQGVEYTVEVSIVNPDGLEGAPYSDTITGAGNTVPPSNVAASSLVGYEFGVFVALSHSPAVDSDLAGYRYKRLEKTAFDAESTDAARWNHADAVTVKRLHQSPGVLLEGQPVGSHMYGVRAVDDWGNESAATAWILVTVTESNSGQIATQQVQGVDDWIGGAMYPYERYGGEVGGKTFTSHYNGEKLTNLFGSEATPFPANQSVNWSYFGYIPLSDLRSTEWDTGSDRSGIWSTIPKQTVLHGDNPVLNFGISLKPDGGIYNDYSNGKALVARYAKAAISVDNDGGQEGMTVVEPIVLSYQGQEKEEEQTVSIPASPQPKTVTYTAGFAENPQLSIVVIGTAPRSIGVDNESNSSCDLRAWDETGAAAAATVKITAKGI